MEHDDENRANRPRKSTTFLTLHKRQADLLGKHERNEQTQEEKVIQIGTNILLPLRRDALRLAKGHTPIFTLKQLTIDRS